MGRFATVLVTCVEGKITCNPENAQLYAQQEPDSIQWVFNSFPEGVIGAQVSFQDEAPFTDFGVSVAGGTTKLVASGYRKLKGYSKYTIRFFDGAGQVVAEVDPAIHHDPLPPVWPDHP